MIVLLSPAKTLDYETPLPVQDFSVSENLGKSEELIGELRKKDPQGLSDLMGLSEKLANLNFERNMNWEPPVILSEESRQAIFAFKGDVYTGLSAYSLKNGDIKFLDKHVRILSGLYGILKPLDLYQRELSQTSKLQKKCFNTLSQKFMSRDLLSQAQGFWYVFLVDQRKLKEEPSENLSWVQEQEM